MKKVFLINLLSLLFSTVSFPMEGDLTLKWERCSNEVIAHTSTYLDDKSLLSLRLVEKRMPGIIEDEIKRRTPIKQPFSCLTSKEKPHPYPHTMSHFLRKLMREAALLKFPIPETQQDTFKKWQEFCQVWNHPAELLMGYYSHGARGIDKVILLEYFLPNEDAAEAWEIYLGVYCCLFGNELDKPEAIKFYNTLLRLSSSGNKDLVDYYANFAQYLLHNTRHPAFKKTSYSQDRLKRSPLRLKTGPDGPLT